MEIIENREEKSVISKENKRPEAIIEGLKKNI